MENNRPLKQADPGRAHRRAERRLCAYPDINYNGDRMGDRQWLVIMSALYWARGRAAFIGA